MIKQNPLQSIESIISNQEEKEMTFLSKEDIETVLLKAEGSKYYLPILIAVHTGMRRGEILGLTWEDINLEDRVITVNKQLLYQNKELILTSPKTKTSNRKFMIPSILADQLQQVKNTQDEHKAYYGEHYHLETNFVCCEEDGSPLKPYELTSFTSDLSKTLDMPFRFHDLRHSHASLLLEADVNVKVIQERLGHSTINTTLNVYSHVSQKLERNSIDKFEKLFATQKEKRMAN